MGTLHEVYFRFTFPIAITIIIPITVFQQSYSNSLSSQPQSVELALSSLKDVLREIIPHEDVERNVLLGEHYLISSEEQQGLVWNKITKALGAQSLGTLTVAAAEKLDISAFKKVMFVW